MAIFEKTWAFDMNRAYVPATALDLTRWTLWYLAASLTGKIGGLTLGLWTPYASSDSVTAGTDATDRWLLNGPYDGTKIVRGAGAAIHSWIVLKSPVMNGFNWYMILSFNSASDAAARIGFAKTAPTGGTSSVTAGSGDQWCTTNSGSGSLIDLVFNAGTADVSRVNLALAAGGDFSFLGCKQGAGQANLTVQFHGLSSKKASDSYPVYTFTQYAAAGVFYRLSGQVGNIYELLIDVNAGSVSRSPAGTLCSNAITAPGIMYWGTSQLWAPTAVDSIDGSSYDFPCWVAVGTHASGQPPTGIRGRVADLAVNPLTGQVSGSVSPATPPYDSTKVGSLWIPSNGGYNFGV